jgi:hypothetical protein
MVPVTLAEIRSTADGIYPVSVLEGCDSALVLFAAGFLGRQDGIFIADAGLDATCVDIRPALLHEMASMYPASWEFFVEDSFEYAATTQRQWDLVSVDCPSGMFQRCADSIETYCHLARRAVVLGTGMTTFPWVPGGWVLSNLLRRSSFAGGTYWAVLERE